MTDKPIIIDGVDVRGCEEINCKVTSPSCYHLNGLCENFPNCYYKQLQRAKDECIRLGNERTADLVQQLQQEKAAHQVDHDKGQSEITRLYGELQRKTAECEELQAKYKWYDHYKNSALSNKELCDKKSDEIKLLHYKLHIATEALKSILDEADVLDEFISKEGYLYGFVNIAQQALEQLGSEE